jgi:hypothetical protein
MSIATIAIVLVAVFFAGVLIFATKKLAEQ